MRLAVLVLISFACAACNGDGSFDSPNTPDTTGMIGAAGGTVEVTSGRLTGTKVVIPAGALAADTGITIASGTNVDFAGYAVGGPAVRFGPEGTIFAQPVTITLPHFGSGLGLEVVHRDDVTGATRVLPSTLDPVAGTVTVTVLSFSTLQGIVPAEGELPTFNADGSWVIRTTMNTSIPAGNENDDEVMVGQINQSGTNFTLTVAGEILPGAVSGKDYSVVTTEPTSGGTLTQTIAFTLDTMDMGSGTVAWTWTDGQTVVTGGAMLEIERQEPMDYDATGTWDVDVSQPYSEPAGSEDPVETIVLPMTQTDSTFTFTSESGTHAGNVSGTFYFASWTEVGETTTRENWIEFELTGPNAGTGTMHWRSTDDLGAVTTGGATLTFTRQPQN
ncbi:MAG: hypothetical protein ACYTGN_18525 [Planctomycetota bacterium]|jgi:hypothetical protein